MEAVQVRRFALAIVLGTLAATPAAPEGSGVAIVPDDDGRFLYVDDFSTPQVLVDAFLTNTGPEVWQRSGRRARSGSKARPVTAP